MRLTIKDPKSENEIEVNAEPEDYNGEQGFRIVLPSMDSFVILERNGEWTVVDDDVIHPDLLSAIARALHPVARYNSGT